MLNYVMSFEEYNFIKILLMLIFFVSAGIQILKGRSENLSGQASNGKVALHEVSV